MSILIGADIVPSGRNKCLFADGDVKSLVGDDLIKILMDADYRVFNLETPLVDEIDPIDKCGSNLFANSSTIFGLKKLGVNLFTLANNHIMDQGEKGLISTINILNENGISHIGAGCNLKQAQEPFILDVKNRKIGFYACAEHEFSIAEDNFPGANPFDLLESFDHIAELKKVCDYVIVLYHGGKEHYQYPSPMLQKVCRKFVQKGADLVICQHSHCIGCEEVYGNARIVYGQGNFIFDSNYGPYSQTSLLIKLTDNMEIEYFPIVKKERGIRLASDKCAENILSDFKKRSSQLEDVNFVNKNYKEFAKKSLSEYMLTFSGYSHKTFIRILNRLCGRKLTNRIIRRYTKKEMLAIRNFVECEAHRELFLTGLKND